MRKLTLSILAAGVVLSAAPALAQQHGGGRGGGGGHWRGGGHVGMPARGPNVQMRHRGGPNVQMRHRRGPNVQFRHRGGFRHPGPHFRHQRMRRGFVIHPFWFGGQFHINNWQVYGFADPGPDRRWVRYYDDAYLIDGGGRVVDYRYGMDWDSYGEEWEVDDGVPGYRGRRDRDADDDDDDDDDDYAGSDRHRGGGHHGRGGHHGGGYQMQGGHYGGGYYGYGFYAYPIVIETVTTGATVYEEVIEEVVEVRHRPRVRRARCHCPPPPRPAPPRRPPPGERG